MIFDGWDSPSDAPTEPPGKRPKPIAPATAAIPTLQEQPQPAYDERHWQSAAACRGSAAELFDSGTDGRGSSGRTHVYAAKQICRGCSVRADCLRYALAHAEPHGIWGGLTPQERHKLAHGKQPGPTAPTGHPSGRDIS